MFVNFRKAFAQAMSSKQSATSTSDSLASDVVFGTTLAISALIGWLPKDIARTC